MYSRFFYQPQMDYKKEQTTVSHSAQHCGPLLTVSQTILPTPPSQLETFLNNHPVLLGYVNHSLRDEAAKDYQDYCRIAINCFEEMEHLFKRCPIRSWQKAIGLSKCSRSGKPNGAYSFNEIRVQAADSAIGLDLEGQIDFEPPLRRLQNMEVERIKKDRETKVESPT